MRTLGVIVAVRDEADAILKDSAFAWEEPEPGVFLSKHFSVKLILSGVGKVYAAWAYSRVADWADAVISLGTSGGLSNEAVGSLFYIDEFVEHDMSVHSLGVPPGVTPYGALKDPVMKSSTEEFSALVTGTLFGLGLQYETGRAISGDEFLADAERSARKRDYFSAQVADMECAAIAKLALSFTHKPYAALRVISDNANHEAERHWAENVRSASVVFDRFLLGLAGGLEKK
jgi:adenosylhomocysteine nucleosidase